MPSGKTLGFRSDVRAARGGGRGGARVSAAGSTRARRARASRERRAGGARWGVRPGREGDSGWSKKTRRDAARRPPSTRRAPRPRGGRSSTPRALAARGGACARGVTRARTRRAFTGGLAGAAPETPRARARASPRKSAPPSSRAKHAPRRTQRRRNGGQGSPPFLFHLIKANNRHSELVVFGGPFMFLKHSEHSSAPTESTSGRSCDATTVRDAHPHGQAHTSPQKRGFLRSGHAPCALLCMTTAPRVCPPARASVRLSTRATKRVSVTESTCLRVQGAPVQASASASVLPHTSLPR